MNLKNNKNASDLAKNIRKYRMGKHMTQEQLGDAVGVSHTAIANYESGYREPDLGTLKRIANRLGVNVSSLLE